MQKRLFTPGLALVLGLGLAACDVPAPPAETCRDASGATYVKPAEGCPAAVPAKVPRPAAPAKPKPLPRPVVQEDTGSGGDGGSDSGGGWGG